MVPAAILSRGCRPGTEAKCALSLSLSLLHQKKWRGLPKGPRAGRQAEVTGKRKQAPVQKAREQTGSVFAYPSMGATNLPHPLFNPPFSVSPGTFLQHPTLQRLRSTDVDQEQGADFKPTAFLGVPAILRLSLPLAWICLPHECPTRAPRSQSPSFPPHKNPAKPVTETGWLTEGPTKSPAGSGQAPI